MVSHRLAGALAHGHEVFLGNGGMPGGRMKRQRQLIGLFFFLRKITVTGIPLKKGMVLNFDVTALKLNAVQLAKRIGNGLTSAP
jgi:hypothetical protein